MELTGKIIKGIAGFYYVNCEDDGTLHTYECKAKGGFRKDKIKPLVGDNVIIDIIDNDKMSGIMCGFRLFQKRKKLGISKKFYLGRII